MPINKKYIIACNLLLLNYAIFSSSLDNPAYNPLHETTGTSIITIPVALPYPTHNPLHDNRQSPVLGITVHDTTQFPVMATPVEEQNRNHQQLCENYILKCYSDCLVYRDICCAGAESFKDDCILNQQANHDLPENVIRCKKFTTWTISTGLMIIPAILSANGIM